LSKNAFVMYSRYSRYNLLMDGNRTSKWAIVALACTVLLIFVPNYAQYQLSPLAHLIMPAYDLDATQFSMLFSAAMVAGIFFSLVAGVMCDRFGVKRVVGIAAIVSVAALVVRVFAPNFGVLFVCMVLAGIVATFLNANMAKIMGSWFSPEKVGVAIGIGLAGSTLAMVVGLGTSAFFPSLQSVFIFTAFVGIVACAAWWLLFKDNPRSLQESDHFAAKDAAIAQESKRSDAGDASADQRLEQYDTGDATANRQLEQYDTGVASADQRPERSDAGDASADKRPEQPGAAQSLETQPSLSECLRVVLKSRNVWLIGVVLGLDMAATMCVLTFLPQVLQTTRGFDPAIAGALSSVVTFGNLTGSIFAPMIAAKVGRFKPVAIVFAVIAGAGTAFAWQLPDGPLMYAGFFLTGFALSGLMTLTVSMVVLLPEIGPLYAGTAGGVAGTLQLFGAVVIPSYILTPILGANYPVFYGVAGFLCLVAAACLFVLPEVFKRS